MDLSDDINQCAYLVKQGDYDRYRAVMTLDPNLRSNLFVLLAANIEISIHNCLSIRINTNINDVILNIKH